MRKHQQLLNVANGLMDACLIVLAYLVSCWLRLFYMEGWRFQLDQLLQPRQLALGVFYALAAVVLYAVFGLYGSFRYKSTWRESASLAGANLLALMGMSTLLYAVHLDEFSRLLLLIFFALSTLLVIGKRMVLRAILEHYRSMGYNTRNLLLLGSGDLACRYYTEVHKRPQLGYRYMGYVADTPQADLGERVCGYKDFSAWLSVHQVDEAVLEVGGLSVQQVGDIVSACGRYSVKLSVIPSYNDFIPGRPSAETLGDLKLINVRRSPNDNVLWRFAKRTMDVLGSGIGIVLTSPIMLAAAIAVKCSSPGPVIFKQKRTGKNGSTFMMYKFRSMYSDAEQRKAELERYNEADGPVFKMANDPRITPVGRFIRKTSIDELPQFFNILKGDMSIVGPRPPLPTEVAQYTDFEWGRLAVKPGLTCYWQVSGRSNLSFEEWMKLDLRYIEEQGFLTDMRILFKTVVVVLKGDGAY